MPASSLIQIQYGEDRILAAEFADKHDGYFVEVGSYNGESYSNTYYLERTMGWSGVLVEADPALHETWCQDPTQERECELCAVAPNSPATVTFEVVEGCKWVSSLSVSDSMLKRIEDIPTEIRKVTVPARTLDTILSDPTPHAGSTSVSIDVEGTNGRVAGFTPSRWKPK